MKRPLLLAAPLAPLLLTLAPRSPLAHDAGYYGLQARWMADSNNWLAPPWFGTPVFDRCIGAQWLMALSLRLFGDHPWVDGLPSLLAAAACLALTGWLAGQWLPGNGAERRQQAWLSVALLALTPLWLNYAHLASQDMLLLAVELAGISALVASDPTRRAWAPWLAGMAPGLAFLIKGFMVALPLLAITPYLLLERRWLLRRQGFWLGLGLGWLPVALWLGLSLQVYGLPVVSGLWSKLLFLSQADVYAAGPLYYLWNVPANTAPWILAALAGGLLLWRSDLARGERLGLLLYPLLLLLLLSGFRTKTPYYGLQLTPWIAMAGAAGLQRWSRATRPLNLGIAGLGVLMLAGASLLAWPESSAQRALVNTPGLPPLAVLMAAAASLGVSWSLLPLARQPRQRLAALLVGPWLALVLLTQGGLFSDRSPALRAALAEPSRQLLLNAQPLQAAASGELQGEEHAQLILLALASKPTPERLLAPAAVQPGERVWIRRSDLEPGHWRVLLNDAALTPWVLAERRTDGAGSRP